jgi:hypothetical protein
MRKDTKLEKIRVAMENNDWDSALKIAASFSRLGKHRDDIKRAAEFTSNPSFYSQIGYDLADIKDKGIKALKERFSRSWESVIKKGDKNATVQRQNNHNSK